MSRKRSRRRRIPDSVRVDGRDWPVLGWRYVRGRKYFVLEKTGSGDRQRFRVFDPHTTPTGEQRALLVLPRSKASLQHVRVLQRVTWRHPNLPAILDCQYEKDSLLLVLTWMRGVDLRSYLDAVSCGRTPHAHPAESVRLIRGLAHGLSQLHRHRQLVHGDIRPQNIVLSTRPTRLSLIDFGSAWRAVETSGRDPGDGFCSIYTAPELQRAPYAADFRSDQFAVTLVLYELLTLQVPYGTLGGKAGLPGFASPTTSRVVPPGQIAPNADRLPRSIWRLIDPLVERGLALDADERFATPRSWLDAIDEVDATIRTLRFHNPSPTRLTRVMDWFSDLCSAVPFLNRQHSKGRPS